MNRDCLWLTDVQLAKIALDDMSGTRKVCTGSSTVFKRNRLRVHSPHQVRTSGPSPSSARRRHSTWLYIGAVQPLGFDLRAA
jgi:hypothetical protein